MNEHVKISKVGTEDNPVFPTSDMADYKAGEVNLGVSVPVNYTITGWLNSDVEIGASVIVKRDTRNGVAMSGVFNTSPVKKIEFFPGGLLFHTENSVYQLEWIDELP